MQYFRIEVVVDDSIFAQFKLIWKEIYRYLSNLMNMSLKKYVLVLTLLWKNKELETSQDYFLEFKSGPSTQPNLGWNRDAFSQNIKTVSTGGRRSQQVQFELPVCRLVPFIIFFSQILKPRTLDLGQYMEEARS